MLLYFYFLAVFSFASCFFRNAEAKLTLGVFSFYLRSIGIIRQRKRARKAGVIVFAAREAFVPVSFFVFHLLFTLYGQHIAIYVNIKIFFLQTGRCQVYLVIVFVFLNVHKGNCIELGAAPKIHEIISEKTIHGVSP